METKKILHLFMAVIFVAVAVSASGCAQKTARPSTQDDRTNWEWVPRVWVEDSYSGGQYDRCSYDENTVGYWCPPGTR